MIITIAVCTAGLYSKLCWCPSVQLAWVHVVGGVHVAAVTAVGVVGRLVNARTSALLYVQVVP